MTMDLQGRVALITGGAHRVGRAIALALADAGVHIALHYHKSTAEALTTLAEIQARGVEAIGIVGDLRQGADCERVVDEAVAWWGRLDMLVCSAGLWGRLPFGSVTEAQWDELFALNTRSVFFLAQRAAAHLREAKGAIVAIGDASSEGTWKGYTPYLTSKAALAALIPNLARELAPEVRVNAVAPGPVLLPEDWGSEQRAKAAKGHLLGHIGSPDDVAKAVVYLAQANFVTGVVLPVDGGMRVK